MHFLKARFVSFTIINVEVHADATITMPNVNTVHVRRTKYSHDHCRWLKKVIKKKLL